MKLITIVLLLLSATPALASSADCTMARVHGEWLAHYTDWKARLIVQGATKAAANMDRSIAEMEKNYSEAMARCEADKAK
jgi:hypothetical protein